MKVINEKHIEDVRNMQVLYERGWGEEPKSDNIIKAHTIPIYIAGALVEYTMHTYAVEYSNGTVMEPSVEPHEGQKEIADGYSFVKIIDPEELNSTLIRFMKTSIQRENPKMGVEGLCAFITKYNMWCHIPDGSPKNQTIKLRVPAAPYYKFEICSEGGGSSSPYDAIEKVMKGAAAQFVEDGKAEYTQIPQKLKDY